MNWVMVVEYMGRAQGPTVDLFWSKPSCDLSLKRKVEPRRPSVTHRRQADGSTRAHAQVHRRLFYGHQGTRHVGPHHREAACFMEPHGYRHICLGSSVSVPAPHSLRTAEPEVCISCVLLVSGKWALLRLCFVSLSSWLVLRPLWGSSGLKFERF